MTPRRVRLRALVPSRRIAIWIALGGLLSLAVSSLAWIAYRAVGEWERSTLLLVDQRSEEALTLLTVALNRDMKGVHHSVLASFNEGALDLDRRYELEDLFAQAFARFPYPESFFVWRDTAGDVPSTFIFNRVDRPPHWAGERMSGAFPVVSVDDAHVMPDVIARVKQLGQSGGRFGAFETTIGGTRYQVVVHLLYHTVGERPLFGAVGFTVNLDWVGGHYFQEILGQIARIGNVEDSISLSVSDASGRTVASTRPTAGREGVLHERTFPLSFLDADLVADAADAVGERDAPLWTLSVSATEDRTVLAASRGSRRTTWLILLCAGTALMGILLTVRALKASADLASMQSEFVASATHDLKTPLALFQLVAETLAKGRYQSEGSIRTYGVMLSEQTQLLERLIDNVLTYGSLQHVAQRYRFEPLQVSTLVEAALERFDARLAATGLEVSVDVPASLPSIRGDRVSLLQVFDNIIDNAIKYSPEGKGLAIQATVDQDLVHVTVRDHGPGIPADERDKVFQKFYRGQSAVAAGSGLGLAIARRVIEDHGGTIAIRDAESGGTIVDLGLRVHRA